MDRFTTGLMRRASRIGQGTRAALLLMLVVSTGVAQQQATPAPTSQKPRDPGIPAAPDGAQQVFRPKAPISTSAAVAAGRLIVQAIPLNQTTASRLEARKSSYSVKVAGPDWVDTHLELVPGDALTLSSKGGVTLADGRKVTPDGVSRGWKDLLRNFPDNGSPAGALVARIGKDPAVVPFAIGSEKQLKVTAGGELFLRINSSSDLAPEGEFMVSLKLAQARTGLHSETRTAANELLSLPSTLFDAVPRRVEDQQGNAGDMVNFALIGTEEKVEKAFETAGWVKVDNSTQDAVVHGVLATLAHKPYLEMPMSTLYLFGRPQDLSYARADPITVAAERHHLRVWRTDQTVNGRPLWVGSSTHDVGFETDQRNGDVTHKIDPEIDKERDFLQQSFAAAGDLQSAAYVTPPGALHIAKTATGGEFHSDGRIVVLDLK